MCVGCGMLGCFYSWEAFHGGNGDGKGCGGGRVGAWDGWRWYLDWAVGHEGDLVAAMNSRY